MFILASRSPQRKTILEDLGIEFTVIPSPFDESSISEKDPEKRALILAEKKAADVAKDHPDQWVIGVDTLVVSEDGQLLEKPVDEEDARRMLQLHSGHTSTVHSAISVQKGSEVHTDLSTARVTFKNLSDQDIDWWIETGLWEDRSGAFQIDGEGGKLIEKLEGEFETVVGFPVQCFQKMSLEE
jgi:septum formation protein